MNNETSQHQRQVNNAIIIKAIREQVRLWHRRLGHLSFSYLHKIKIDLFMHVRDSEVQCEIFELVKSHRISYLLSSNRSTIPFMIVHFDVWGTACILVISYARYSY